jgi:hypothetical protein
MYVASISSGCCKSKFRCCNGCICMFQAYVLSASFIFRCMFQVLHLNVLKEDLGEHMLQWSRCLANSVLPQPSATATEAPSWVTVRVPKAGRRLCRVHMQAR